MALDHAWRDEKEWDSTWGRSERPRGEFSRHRTSDLGNRSNIWGGPRATRVTHIPQYISCFSISRFNQSNRSCMPGPSLIDSPLTTGHEFLCRRTARKPERTLSGLRTRAHSSSIRDILNLRFILQKYALGTTIILTPPPVEHVQFVHPILERFYQPELQR